MDIMVCLEEKMNENGRYTVELMTVREHKVVEVVAGRGNILDMVVEEAS